MTADGHAGLETAYREELEQWLGGCYLLKTCQRAPWATDRRHQPFVWRREPGRRGNPAVLAYTCTFRLTRFRSSVTSVFAGLYSA